MQKVLELILVVISIFLLLYFTKPEAIYSYQKEETKENENLEIATDDTSQKDIFNNEKVVAHLTSPIGIDTLITQSTDNSYYLKHDLYDKETKEGQAFLDYRNKIDESYQLNIYGHHFKDHTGVFAPLINYTSYAFYKEYPKFFLETRKRKSEYLIFSVIGINKDNNEHMKLTFSSQTEFLHHLEKMKEHALYDTKVGVNATDKILVLQTCNYDKAVGDYLLILMKEVKSYFL